MKQIEQIKEESINEFGSQATQARYAKIAEFGFWVSEAMLIDKYFRPKSKILDIGCGSGRTTIALHQQGYEVVGVDVTPAMIAGAKKIAEAKGLSIDYQVGDAINLKFPDNCFDGAIFANNGWVQIPGKDNRQKAMNEIYRVLKPGGYFILAAHQRYHSGNYLFFWPIKWFRFYILKPLGFKIDEVDFGDLFFRRPYVEGNIRQRQFIHLTSRKEVEAQISRSGLTLEMRKSMAELSSEDAKEMEGSLSKRFNSYKSPIFYVCQKPIR